MLTMKVRYALQALLYLSTRRNAGFTLGSEIAEANKLPKNFLVAILLELRNGGLLISKKGRGGGFALKAPEATIMVGDVVRILDGRPAVTPCGRIDNDQPCGAEGRLCHICRIEQQIQDATAEILDNTSLLDLAVERGIPFILNYDV